ncbi:tRNA (N(6)-L-threonylcarbamoyladenosine(37)-C(2))-methylthiotransferase [Candidatus Woesearchaeota archaeon]|nr:tRNA (N(6)-L-threonylcarbamoyladenosine(37)-C(2))-methylthiotransferase [Candidatus Woesearchaeota archaeon]
MGKKVYIKTFGCTINRADSLTMENLLKNKGYKIVDEPKGADFAIINSCTVKYSAEAKMFVEIEKVKPLVKHIILAGCVPQAEHSKTRLKNYNIIGVDKTINVVDIIESVSKGLIIQNLEHDLDDTLEIEKSYNQTIEIVPISKGCLGDCSYCKTRQARGTLHSFSKTRILSSIKRALDTGKKEIWLSSQDCGAYGLDIKSNLAELLHYILKNTPKNYRIRLGMSNPNFISKLTTELIEIFKDDRMFKFLHIPVQSGSNRILKLMRRQYQISEFTKIITEFRQVFPDITIATDIIVGFPTETEEDFLKSYNLVKRYKIPILNYSRFWPRPNTDAAKLEELSLSIMKERTSKLKQLHEKTTTAILKELVGHSCDVLVDELDDSKIIGRTNNYLKIILKTGKLSTFKTITVVKSGRWELYE